MYEYAAMRVVEMFWEREERGWSGMMEGMNLVKVYSKCHNVSPVQL
jgi:hypothetical protein